MRILKKFYAFLKMDSKTKLLLVEAFLFLGWARILLCLPFSKVAPNLGNQMHETPFTCSQLNAITLRDVSNSIHVMSNYTIWESKCFVKALAGMKMLKRRKIESTLYLGTAKDDNGKMIAHAWLRSGSYYVTGVEGMKQFTVVGRFANVISGHS